MLFIFPCDPLNERRVDPHFARERDAARDLGHPTALTSFEALRHEEAVFRQLVEGAAVYRGWMLPPGSYHLMDAALAARGTHLITSAAQYRAAHELPGWYDVLVGVTPLTVYNDSDLLADFSALAVRLSGAAVLRDYSKSEKHYWDEAAFIPDTASPHALKVAARFRELREDDFVGGFVLRRFEQFVGPEVRTWWREGRLVLSTAHPDGDDVTFPVPDLGTIGPAIARLALPFVTADVVQRADGVWRVVEVGDGQVSDLHAGVVAEQLIAAIVG